MTIYGYCRVSTVDQADNGNSLEVQRERVKAEAKAKGLGSVSKFFVDRGVSGGKLLSERPQGNLLLSSLSGGDIVIALKLDRMFRNASDAVNQLEQFKEKGIRLILLDMGEVTGNGIAAMLFTILSAVAQFERERIGERISEAKALAKTNMLYTGGRIPFGYDVIIIEGVKKLQENKYQQCALHSMLEWRNMQLSYKKIMKRLFDNYGIKLSHAGVKKILERKALGY